MTYYISDAGGGDNEDAVITASQITYTNTTSGLSATNIQGAIDEMNVTTKTALTFNSSNYSVADSRFSWIFQNGKVVTLSLSVKCDTPPSG